MSHLSKDSKIFIISIIFIGIVAALYFSNNFVLFSIKTAIVIAVFLALNRLNKKFTNLKETYLSSLETITQLIEEKVNTTNGHATNVARLARQIAAEMKLNQHEIDAIHLAALLHDIGELKIDERIFKKRGPLTLEEERQFRQHPEIGAKMVEGIAGFQKAAEYIRYHHEQWDGKGYPAGKKGNEIPLGARIIAAANEYDRIICSENKRDPKKALEELAGTKLDPDLVRLLIKFVDIESESPFQVVDHSRISKDKVLKELNKNFTNSKLLRDFGNGRIVYYQYGNFYNLEGKETDIPCKDQVIQLIRNSLEKSDPQHEFIEDLSTGKTFNIHWIKMGGKIYLLIFDVSYLLEYERKQEVKIRKIYREVIHSVTQGKLFLLEMEELKAYYDELPLLEKRIKKREDVATCRKSVEKLLTEFRVKDKKKFNLLLTVSEAVTNVLKHAEEGKMIVYLKDNWIGIIVEDKGNGIQLSDLPKSALFDGYSSKKSMGQGFGLMLKLVDKVAIYTSQEGTTVIMESQLEEQQW